MPNSDRRRRLGNRHTHTRVTETDRWRGRPVTSAGRPRAVRQLTPEGLPGAAGSSRRQDTANQDASFMTRLRRGRVTRVTKRAIVSAADSVWFSPSAVLLYGVQMNGAKLAAKEGITMRQVCQRFTSDDTLIS